MLILGLKMLIINYLLLSIYIQKNFLGYFNVYKSIIYSVSMQIFRKKNDIFTHRKLAKNYIFNLNLSSRRL